MEKYRLNNIFTNEIRFYIMSLLAMYEKVDFNFLKNELEVSDGNLSVQLRKLEEAGYIKVHKTFIGRRPKTWYNITSEGLKALSEFLDRMSKIKEVIDKKGNKK